MDIRPARSEDRPAIIATLRAAFGGWHGDASEAYWEWKFERNPHGRAHVWVADDGGTVAGCYVWNPVRLRANGGIVDGAQSVDAAVHPGYQGRGVFTDLARAAIEHGPSDIQIVYAFPTEGAYRGQLRVGFRDLFPLAKAYRPLLVRPHRDRGSGLEFPDVERFDARFDVFAAGRGANGLSVARDAEYLQWRYADHPARVHETIACERDGQLRAYCVLTVRREPGWASPGYIVDLQALPDGGEDARRLVTRALARLGGHGSRVAVAWMPSGGPEADALADAGFSPTYGTAWRKVTRPHFVDRFIAFDARANGGDDDRVVAHWDVVPGDADYM